MKITNVEWNEGAPAKLEPGMVIDFRGAVLLIGHVSREDYMNSPEYGPWEDLSDITRWAWLIQPHELAWLEDMANKHKARARG
ncbi:TPA: hypothetical protein NIA63_005523 [Pseudomonas aeruginosa]|nr:hypothetical protein [Pseudomonas aeruginosa]HCF2363398.1 hypothetical protein [Pseudomonas aeruginosa]